MKYYYNCFFLFLIGISGIISSCIKEAKLEKNEIAKCPECETFYHGGEHRGYILYKPVNLSENAPLVFVLHGYTSNAPTIRNITKMNRIADQHGFVVCYPQGTINKWSKTTHWNSGLTYSNTDDIGFLTRLAKYLQNKYNLNPEKTFSSGMSNGGFMSYTLACEASEVFKGIASVTGTMSGSTWKTCNPNNAVPVLQISGVQDDVVPIDGTMDISGGWGGAPHMDEIINFWSNLNKCQSQEASFFPPLTNAYYHKKCTNDNEVWYFKINNWGHEWPYDDYVGTTGIKGSEIIWEFFSKI